MSPFKKYFTEGLIQVAIVISLLRADVDNYINTFVDHNYPEMQEIILGTSLGYAQTDFHRSNQQLDLGGYTQLKSLDSYYSSSVFRDLFTPETYRNTFHVPTNIDTWLVSHLQPRMSHAANTTSTNNDSEQASTVDTPTQPDNLTQVENAVSQPMNGATTGSGIRVVEPTEPENALSTVTSSGSELTTEDMDLIEVLWRQDIDLGVGRDVYNITLLKELEKERELKLQQQEQEESKTAELLQEKPQCNYVQDSETGEMVAAPLVVNNQNSPQIQSSLSDDEPPPLEAVEGFSIEEAMRILQVDQASAVPPHQGNYTSHNLTQMETLLHNVPPQPNMTATSQLNMSIANQVNMSMANQANMSMANQPNMTMANQANMSMVIQPNMTMAALPNMSVSTQLNMTVANLPNMSMATQFGMPMMTEPNMPMATQLGMLSRPQFESQTSFELRWQDVASILDLPGDANHCINTSMPSDVTMEMTPAAMPTSEALLQNVSLATNTNCNNLTQSFDMPIVSAGNFSPMDTNETMSPALLGLVNGSTGPLPMTMFNMDTRNLVYTGGNVPMASDNDTFSNTTGALFQSMLEDNVDDFTFPNVSFESAPVSMAPVTATNTTFDEAASDSAISSMEDSSHTQDCNDSHSDISPYDGLEGATGGCSNGAKHSGGSYNGCDAGYSDGSGHHKFGRLSADRSFNHSGSTNNSCDMEPADFRQIRHNHTYSTQPGQQPRTVKKYANVAATARGRGAESFKRSGMRGMQKMAAKNLPFTANEIVDCPVERFMEMLHKYALTDMQLQMTKDIRRRGKNKVAAQNCRKRKLGVLASLEEEVMDLEQQKENLMIERGDLSKDHADASDKVQQLYTQLFRSMRDDNGQPYDPNEYSLQYTADGEVFIVPRNMSNGNHPCIDSHSEKCTKKRKSKKGD